jgi:DNA-binding protein HU-beta
MTKTELQSALAEATHTDKRTAGVFLDTLGAIAYKEIKKNGAFVLPGFGKLVKQKRKARTGFNPKTQQKIKIPAKTVVKFRVAKAAKDAFCASEPYQATGIRARPFTSRIVAFSDHRSA